MSSPPLDLTDPGVRAGVVARLSASYAGRPVILGPGILAGLAPVVARFVAMGCPVLVLATGRGAGPAPPAETCTVVDVAAPATSSMTEEVRAVDRLARHLPAPVVATIEAFDPQRRGWWVTSPFVTTDEPILGRPVTGGRPAAWVALEDKMLADAVWAACDVPHAPYRIVPVAAAALAEATAELATPLGTVWSGDARDGLNGGGNFVRWVGDQRDRAAAAAFFAPRCDRVRVQPFLDGVPCSIHGFVLPDGTAAFRPVELSVLRSVARRRFVYGGLSTWWDPPRADREAMRAVVRRVGDHLGSAHGYRGAFGIDGVLTAEGFLPTELNPRFSAGMTQVAAVAPDLFALAQAAAVAGHDVGLGARDLEGIVALMDAERTGRPVAVGQGSSLGGSLERPVALVGGRLLHADQGEGPGADTGSTLVAGDTPVGFFAQVSPCALLGPGQRLAPLNVALLDLLDREHGTSFGPLEAAPDLRH